MSLLVLGSASAALSPEWVKPEVGLLQFGLVLFLVLLNGFFVASEFAIVKARGSQLDALAQRGERRAERARHLTANLEPYLSATQLGITLASLALGWVGEPFLAQMLHPLFLRLGVTSEAVILSVSLTVAFTIMTFLHIVLGELAPKSLAIRQPVPTTLWIARPLHFFYRAFRPAIWLLNGAANLLLKHVFQMAPAGHQEVAHSEEELRLLLAESAEAKTLSARGTEISLRAFGLHRRAVRDIITPRREVVFLDADAPFAENLKTALASRHTRFPLCREHLDEAIGLIHLKDVVGLPKEPPPDLTRHMRELLTVPEMMSLDKLLDLFLSKHAHLALVLDEFGGAVGIVTLDNVLESLVGHIQDEFDPQKPKIELSSEEDFTLPGELNLQEAREVTGLPLESSEVTTLGGYITEQFGRLPQTGEQIELGEFLVSVRLTDGRRVKRLQFQRVSASALESCSSRD